MVTDNELEESLSSGGYNDHSGGSSVFHHECSLVQVGLHSDLAQSLTRLQFLTLLPFLYGLHLLDLLAPEEAHLHWVPVEWQPTWVGVQVHVSSLHTKRIHLENLKGVTTVWLKWRISFHSGKDLCKGEFQFLLHSTCITLLIDGCHKGLILHHYLKPCHSCNSGDKCNCQNNKSFFLQWILSSYS